MCLLLSVLHNHRSSIVKYRSSNHYYFRYISLCLCVLHHYTHVWKLLMAKQLLLTIRTSRFGTELNLLSLTASHSVMCLLSVSLRILQRFSLLWKQFMENDIMYLLLNLSYLTITEVHLLIKSCSHHLLHIQLFANLSLYSPSLQVHYSWQHNGFLIIHIQQFITELVRYRVLQLLFSYIYS